MRAVLILGSNLGDRYQNLEVACKALEARVGAIVQSSGSYETPPWGFSCDDEFLNRVVVAQTTLEPHALLDTIKSIERGMGRVAEEPPIADAPRVYTSRIIDIDILFYDDLVIETPRLTIPHPLICERDFVLTPLKEILGDFVHPVIGKIISEL